MPKIADIEYTPNPNAVKFILKEPLTGGSSRSFQNPESAQADPLAAALFAVGNVTSVFYMDRFVTVNKEDEAPWEEMLKKLAEPIRTAPTVSEAPAQPNAPVYAPGENPLLDRINQVLDENRDHRDGRQKIADTLSGRLRKLPELNRRNNDGH
jgi:hypothetical protein